MWVQENIAIIEGCILLGHRIYKTLLKLEQIRNELKDNFVLMQAKKYYNQSFSELEKLLPVHNELLDKVKNITKNQRKAFILFVPISKRMKYISAYNKRYNVFKKDFEKEYFKQLKKLQLEPVANAQAISNLQEKYANSLLKTSISPTASGNLLTTTDFTATLAALSADECSNSLKDILAAIKDKDQLQVILRDLSYLARHGVFRDQETIKLYYL